MNYRYLLIVATMVAVTMLVGCDEQPTNPNTYVPELIAARFQIIALNYNTVRLTWLSPNYDKGLAYRIRWRPSASEAITATTDTGTTVVGDPTRAHASYSVEISNLQPKLYSFTVQVLASDNKPVDATVEKDGAPAIRFAMDAARPGQPLRLYEPGSSEGNGLIIDPAAGGPTRLVPTSAPPGALQFVFLFHDTTDAEFQIAVAGIVDAHIPDDLIDFTTWVADGVSLGNEFSVDDPNQVGLDGWYVSDDCYTSDRCSFSENEDFVIQPYFLLARMGEPSGTHFRCARIFIVPKPDRTLLRGEAPNRYIEFEISLGYLGVPFA